MLVRIKSYCLNRVEPVRLVDMGQCRLRRAAKHGHGRSMDLSGQVHEIILFTFK